MINKTTNERKEQWVSERRAYVLLYLYYQTVHNRTIISYLISISFRPDTEFRRLTARQSYPS